MNRHGGPGPDFGWSLPPGCRDSDIPGNSPEDVAWDAACEKAGEEFDELSDEEREDAGDESKWIEARAAALIEEWAEAKADAKLDAAEARWEEEHGR